MNIVLYCIVLYCIVLYCIVLYCIEYCIVLYCIVLYCIVLYCIVLYCIVLYCIVLYCIVLYCDAEQRKLNKYEGLKQFFIGQGKQCHVFGFVIGALGSWHPANENVLRELGMSKRYRSLFRKLCCTDVIQGSTNVYREHLGITDGSPDVPENSE